MKESHEHQFGWKCTVGRRLSPARFAFATLCVLAVAGAVAPSPGWAQYPESNGGRNQIFVGSELESYARYLQTLGGITGDPWSIRPFSAVRSSELLSSLGEGGWRRAPSTAPLAGGFSMEILPATAGLRFNSGFAFGSNDGAIWVGRGVTASASAGVAFRAGPLTLTLAPVAFRALNQSYDLALGAGVVCPPTCNRGGVDRPDRFGSAAYQRFDLGQSTLSISGLGATAGFTTANESWGPMQDYPFLLGANAPGIPRMFFGSGHPLNVWVGRFSGRVIYGRVDQSEFSPVSGPKYFVSATQPGRVRFASGFAFALQPRGLDGLELGLARFVHSTWPSSGIPGSYLRIPFRGYAKSSLTGGPDDEQQASENQLGSAFFRWAFPHSGMEFYGEYGRDDYNYDFRDLIQEPDHARSYGLGFRKVFGSDPSSFSALRMEMINFQLPTLERTGRGEGRIYEHSVLRQGHTNRGQLLGANVGTRTAAGSTVAWDRYSGKGRLTFKWLRNVRDEAGNFSTTGVVNPHAIDVIHGIGVESLRFGRLTDLTTSVTLLRDFNRNFSSDVTNLNLLVALTLPNR